MVQRNSHSKYSHTETPNHGEIFFTDEREGLGATALRAVLADIVRPLLFSRLTEPWHPLEWWINGKYSPLQLTYFLAMAGTLPATPLLVLPPDMNEQVI